LHRRSDHVGKLLLVILERCRIGSAILEAIPELTIRIEVERGCLAAAYDHDPSRSEGVPHTEFVPDVGIIEGQVRDHQIGDQQLLEHVGFDVAGADLLIGPERFKPSRIEGRRDVLAVHPIEVDGFAVRPGLDPERHGGECAGTDHGFRLLLDRLMSALDLA
jgi:hypothetical protein